MWYAKNSVKLSDDGKAKIKAIMDSDNAPKIKTARDLSIAASHEILDEVLLDIEFQQEITLAKLIEDGRLKLNKEKLKSKNVFYDSDLSLKLNWCQIIEWVNNHYLVGNKVSEDTARFFVKRIEKTSEDVCKYFCKCLGVFYTQVIENEKKLPNEKQQQVIENDKKLETIPLCKINCVTDS